MAITTDCAGFTKAQSDIYRKIIGKKKVDEIDKYNQWLVYGNEKENISGLIVNRIPEEKALQLAEELVAFAKYSLKFIERYLDILKIIFIKILQFL